MTEEAVRIGIILSAGGAAFISAAKIAADLPVEFNVVTDRPCGAEDACRSLGLAVHRIEHKDNETFSTAARDYFLKTNTEAVLLHFSRLITSPLFECIPCCNVHASLLPLFPGFSAIQKTMNSGMRFMGATLHLVDNGVDAGPIIAQTATPLVLSANAQWCERTSFLQKTLLTLVFCELLASRALLLTTSSFKLRTEMISHSPRANPTLMKAVLIEGFSVLQSSLNFEVFP